MNLSVKEITTTEFATLEKQIRASHVGISSLVETWKSLDAYFNKASIFEDEKFRWTYFRIYTELTWKLLDSQSRDFVINVAVARQIPMAIQLGFNVFEEILRYIGSHTVDKTDAEGLYLKMQKSFLESKAIIGAWQGKNVSIAQIIQEINSVYEKGDSLAQADFENKLLQIMFPDEISKKYSTADPEDVKENFLDLVSSFQTFTIENIWYIVDAFLNPEKYQNATSSQAASSALTKPEPSKPAVSPQPIPKQEEPKLVVPPTIRPKPTPQQIKSQIESQFKKDAEGNLVDIEGVMTKLGELAEKNNDPKIADMIYFDEKESKFKWNI
ncbi:MAG: hypothetical protein G01um101413_63 [Parcubacteria group bacterium Gr01-1014_13]|nr:MAG: hypothetical protein G01um101413_63 [Parcubacteria group bacterium Gr01-1014_13]